MATYSDVMRWKAELDNTGVLKGFDEIETKGKKSLDEVGDKSEGLGDRFKGAGSKMGKALVAGFAAVGVGAILLAEMDKAFSRQDSMNIVSGRFALTAEEAKKYGGIAGELYADGWGSGLEEVQQAVAATFEKLEVNSEEAGKALARDALAVSETWGTDVDSVLRSTNQLLENDLVTSSREAMDLIVAAFQNGGDEAGDLLDTIDEYAQHWSDMGLSGEDALNQIIHGFENGQRDADKMADAIKEMGLRVREGTDPVREALQDIGLDADDTIEAFLEGGPRARDAFLKVIEALAEGQAQGDDTGNAVAIIGTQFEDLGSKALESLGMVDGALQDTTGAAEALSETVEATEWDKFQRNAEGALGHVGNYVASQVNPAFEAANDLWGGVFGSDEADQRYAAAATMLQGMKGDFDNLIDSTIEAASETEDFTAQTKTAEEISGDHFDALMELNEGYDDVAGSAEDAARETRDFASEFEDLKRGIQSGRSARDLARAFDEVESSAEAAYTAAAEGADDAQEKLYQSQDAVDDLKLSVLEYGDELGNLPDKVTSDILALIDQGAYAEAEAQLERIRRQREALIVVRTVNGGVTSLGSTRPSGVNSGNSGVSVRGAEGAIVNRPTQALIGEAGPEAVIPLDKVPGNGSVDGLARSLGGGATFNITVNAGLGTNGADVGREIIEAIRRFERGSGSGWRT